VPLLRNLVTDRQLRNADFRRFWFSSTLTDFGAQITLPALPIGAAGAGALAERLGVRGGLTVVAAGALLLTLTTLFGTRLHQIRH
jgi:hypothetical protein